MKRTAAVAAVICAIAALSGCRTSTGAIPSGGSGSSKVVTLTASDGWRIVGDLQGQAGAKRAVVLLHQRGGSASDWRALQDALDRAGIASLAIDQRGAGRSKGAANGPDAPWDTAPDIAAALAWLRAQGFSDRGTGLAGASYGANNALIYAARTSSVPAVALLSPGDDYHGLVAEPAARRYRGALLAVTGDADTATGGGPEVIAKTAPRPPQTVTLHSAGHGTELLSEQPSAVGEIVEFFAKSLPAR